MGLFDRKREPEPEPPPKRPPAQRQPDPPPQRQPPPKKEPAPPKLKFGIQKAMELMRDLPKENVELVVQVVKATLESMSVDVGAIIKDAKKRQAGIEARINTLEGEITGFEKQISTRRQEIGELKADNNETRLARERLEMAQKG